MFVAGLTLGFTIGAIAGALFVGVGGIALILVYSGIIKPEQVPFSTARADAAREVVGV